MKSLLTIIAFFLFLQTNAQNDLNEIIPKDKNVITGILPNGIHYYIRHNSKPEKRAELRLAINAGSTSEDDDQRGLAHMTEHMAFNGTEHFKKNELVDYLESVGTKFGAHLNAYTSFDETVYMIQLPTDSQPVVAKGLEILHDWANNLSFDSLEVEKERGVVIEEWRLGQGAGERMNRKTWPIIFKSSRYADRLPIGKKEIIEKCPQNVLKRFYADWYRPDLMSVVAVGDFDVKLMQEKIIREFFSIPGKKNARPLQEYTVPMNKELIIATATDKETKYSNVSITFKQPEKKEITVGDYLNGIRTQIYSMMLNERLNELEQLPDAPFLSASCGYSSYLRHLDAYGSNARAKDDNIELALRTIVTENERVRRFGFTESELMRAKSDLMSGMEAVYNERDKAESRTFAREYVSNYLTGEPMPEIEYEYELVRKHIDEIKLAEINKFANDWITSGENCVVLITAPENAISKIPSDQTIKSIFNSMKDLKLEQYNDKIIDKPLVDRLPNGAKVTSEKLNKDFNITEWNFSNGIKIFVKPTDFKNDEIIFSSYSLGGWSLYGEKDFRSAAAADDIIENGGVGEFDIMSLSKKLSGKIVSCSPYISELQQGMTGSCSPRDLGTMMELIYAYHTSPRKDSSAFISYLEKIKGSLKNKNADPQSVFSDTVSYIMSSYNYHSKPVSIETLKEFNLQRSFEIYKERFANASSSVYFFVGNFNVDTLKNYVEKYLGALPVAQDKNMWKDIGAYPPKGKIEKTVRMGAEPRTTVVLSYNMPFQYNRNNRNELNVLSKLMNIRLREVLREEKSGVYHVTFSSSPEHFPVEHLEQSIYFACDPDKTNSLIDAAMDVIKEVKEKGCDEKNLNKIKEMSIRERETYMKENSFWLGTISTNYQNGEDISDLLHYNDWVKSLKGSDFISFAKKYIQQENSAKFILDPALTGE